MTDSDRRRRIARTKGLMLAGIIVLTAVPTVLSVILAVRMYYLERDMRDLKQELETNISWRYEEAEYMSFPPETEPEPGTESEPEPDTPAFHSDAEGDLQDETDSIRAWEKQQELSKETGTADAPALRKVYLTFDDGPSIYTDRILDILDEYGVKATFFAVAQGKEHYEDRLRRIVDEGHTLGMHSYSHRYGEIYASKENFIKDVNQLQDYLYRVTGKHPEIYRFPGGSSNKAAGVDMSELEQYLREVGITYFDWNISSKDATYNGISSQAVIYNCTRDLEQFEDAVILMHDSADKRSTVEALPGLIEKILSYENTVIVPITKDTVPVQHRTKLY